MLVDRDHRHVRQVGAADIFRRIETPKSELARDFVDAQTLRLSDAETAALGLPRQHRGLQRHQLVGDEAADEVGQHAMLFGEFEIHSSFHPSCRHCRHGEDARSNTEHGLDRNS